MAEGRVMANPYLDDDATTDGARLRRLTAPRDIWRDGDPDFTKSDLALLCLTAFSIAVIVGGLMLLLSFIPVGAP